jgi:hypothetical protein
MEEEAFSLVRLILRSAIFLAGTIDEQTVTLEKILATGQITRDHLLLLINEAVEEQKAQEKQKDKKKRK